MHLKIILIVLLWAALDKISALQSVPSNKIANVGEALRLKCPNTDIFSTVIYWRFQSTNTIISYNYTISSSLPIDVQERYSIVNKDDSQFTLRISDFRESDARIYECGYIDSKEGKFVSLYSTNVTIYLLNVDSAFPICSLDGSSQSIVFSSSVSIGFTCSIKPYQLEKGYVLQWVRDNKILYTSNKNTLPFFKELTVGDINKLYTCQLLNKNSKTDVKECRIQTFEYPVLLSQELNEVKLGSDLNISCDVRSSSDSPTWRLPNDNIRKRSRILNTDRTLFISNISVSDNNTEITCSYGDYTRTATIVVVLESDAHETATSVALKEYTSSEDKKSGTKKDSSGTKSAKPKYQSSGDDMDTSPTGEYYSTSSSFVNTEAGIPWFNINAPNLPAKTSPSVTYLTSSPPSPTESLSGFQEFLQMVHMSYRVFIAAAIGTFVLLVFLLVLAISCYKYVQSKKPARLAISDSFYSGLANVHKNTNYPLHYNAMHKRSFGRHSGASSLFGEDDMEGSNLLEIIVQGKFPDNCDIQFSDTLDHCNPDDSCLSSAKDFGNLTTGTKDYGTSADTLDGTDEGICSGSGETRFDFDFDSPVNTKQSKVCQQSEVELSIVKDTLC